MVEKKTITWGIILLVLISSFSIGYYFYNRFDSEDNKGSYKTVSYNLTIETEENDNYTIHIPVPLLPGQNEPVDRIIDNLTIEGELDYSVIETNSPIGEQKVLKVEGMGSGMLEFHRTFPKNTSEQRVKYRTYQIVDLSLLHNNRRNCYMYLNNKTSIHLNFNTYYSSVDTEKWECYWKTDSKIKIDEGWNDVELNYYMDPDK